MGISKVYLYSCREHDEVAMKVSSYRDAVYNEKISEKSKCRLSFQKMYSASRKYYGDYGIIINNDTISLSEYKPEVWEQPNIIFVVKAPMTIDNYRR